MNTNKDYYFYIKCNFLGDTGVGKTSLGNLFSNKYFSDNIKPTIGVEHFSRILKVNNEPFKLQIWELSGNRNFDNIINLYMKKIKLSFVIFSLNDKKSFENVNKWINKIKENCYTSEIILIGNKSDLKKEVSNDKINNITSLYNIKYIEISIKNNNNIENLNNTIKNLLPKIKNKKIKRNYCYCLI